MLQYIVLGAGFAFAAVIQPGPLQAFLLSRVAAAGWRRTLPAALAPLISDGPIAVLSLVVLGQLPRMAQEVLRGAGGLLLLYLGLVAFRQFRDPAEAVTTASAPRTLLDATLVNLLNPHPYLGWSLVLGPSVLTAWSEHPGLAIALVAAFYGTIVLGIALFIALVGTARFLGPRGQRALVGVSAVVLVSLGVLLVASAIWRVAGPAASAG